MRRCSCSTSTATPGAGPSARRFWIPPGLRREPRFDLEIWKRRRVCARLGDAVLDGCLVSPFAAVSVVQGLDPDPDTDPDLGACADAGLVCDGEGGA